MTETDEHGELTDDQILSNVARMHIMLGLAHSPLPIDLVGLVSDTQKQGGRVGYNFQSNQLVREIAVMEKESLIGVVRGGYTINPKGLYEMRASLMDTRRMLTTKLDGSDYGK